MAYIKIPLEFPDDKRVKELRSRIGLALATHVVVTLWRLAGKEPTKDGRLTNRSVCELESELGWTGKRGRLEQLLIECCWLSHDDEGYEVLLWDRDQGHIAKFKERAKKAALALWNRSTVDATSNATSNAKSMEVENGDVGLSSVVTPRTPKSQHPEEKT